MINEATKRSLDRAPIPSFAPGIVLTVDPTNVMANVAVDGDATGSSFGADILAPNRFVSGDRVMLMFVKPHGCYVVGRRQGDWDDWHVVGNDDEAQFGTGWTHDASTSGLGTNAPAYVSFTRRSDRVELRGMADQVSGSSDVIFTLPDGYRPANDLYLSALGALTVNTSIRIDMLSGDVARNGADTTIILDGISFVAAIPVDIS